MKRRSLVCILMNTIGIPTERENWDTERVRQKENDVTTQTECSLQAEGQLRLSDARK